MVRTEEEMWEISRNPILLRKWCRHMVVHWRVRAFKQRRLARQMTTKEGQDHWVGRANLEDAVANTVARDINTWVRTCLDPAVCTCGIAKNHCD
jgi:hypothetical protein